jgi:hypothetical protein
MRWLRKHIGIDFNCQETREPSSGGGMKIEVECIQKMGETRRRVRSGRHEGFMFKPSNSIN